MCTMRPLELSHGFVFASMDCDTANILVVSYMASILRDEQNMTYFAGQKELYSTIKTEKTSFI